MQHHQHLRTCAQHKGSLSKRRFSDETSPERILPGRPSGMVWQRRHPFHGAGGRMCVSVLAGRDADRKLPAHADERRGGAVQMRNARDRHCSGRRRVPGHTPGWGRTHLRQSDPVYRRKQFRLFEKTAARRHRDNKHSPFTFHIQNSE
ncbi:unknown [Bacteroides sp. CAG:1060]|nr:unknown [Bacteroides sp. CAG:1060]